MEEEKVLYLRRLEIQGFKSFAERTTISLEPGLNVIVGPNGCGKSNVVDAIRWVLGEANVRSLRGLKGEDVIFNGSDHKRSQGMAVVEMILDNTEPGLDLDFTEIGISRKLFRSGESEFKINKNRVRMKDITALLSGTGLGKQGYSVISQGELEALLKAQPFERRLLLEEAAGIIKYRQQRDEVQRRIQNSSNDLLRLEDLLSELYDRRTDLQEKSLRARQWIELDTAHRQLDKELMALELVQLQGELQKRQQELAGVQGQLVLARQTYTEMRATQEARQLKLEQQQSQLRAVESRQQEREARLAEANSELRICDERINNDQERIRSGREEQKKYRAILAETEEDLQEKRDRLMVEKQRWEEKEEEFQVLKEETATLQSAIDEYQQQLSAEKSLVFERAQEEVRLRNQNLKLEQELKQAQERGERAGIHLQEREHRTQLLSEQIGDLRRLYEEDHDALRELRLRLSELEEEYGLQQEEMEHLRREENRLDRELAKLDNQLLAVREQERNLSGYSQSVRDFLLRERGQKKGISGIRGAVGELITVPEGLEVAIEIAMGRAMENVIVDQAEQARQAIELLKREHLGRITFLPLDILQARRLEERQRLEVLSWSGVIGVAAELISYEPDYQLAMDYLLGRIIIVEDLSRGIDLFRQKNVGLRLVSLEGDVLQASGAMTGGNASRRQSSPLQRKNEIRTLEARRAERAAELETERQRIEQLYDRILDAEGELRELQQRQTELLTRSRITAEQVEKLQQEKDRVEQDLKWYRRELEQEQQRQEELQRELAGLRQNYEALLEQNRRLSEDSAATRAVFDQKQRELDVREERARVWQEQLQNRAQELEALRNNLEQFQQIQASCQRSLEEAEQAELELQADLERRHQQKAEQQSLITVYGQELAELKDQREAEERNEQSCRENLQELKQELLQHELQGNELEAAYRSLELKEIRIVTELEGQQLRWQEKYGTENYEPWYQPISVAKAREQRREMEKLAEQLSALGAVDPDSIQEFERIQERYAFLEGQINDLQQARSSLEKMLRETEKMLSEEFNTFLTAASDSFQQTFVDIFNGGDAHLQLQPSEDEFHDGIDLVVKMPGKRLQSLSLLSGGEKALTCIAFIFALLKLNPAPFCVVDEVDAALDESNLLRFTRFIQRLAKDIQFIVITHRQATIESGERIYGVTMAEQGVSTVLVLNYEQAQEIAG